MVGVCVLRCGGAGAGTCSTVHGLTFNVQKLFMDMDARLWEECTQKHKLNTERCCYSRPRLGCSILMSRPLLLIEPSR